MKESRQGKSRKSSSGISATSHCEGRTDFIWQPTSPCRLPQSDGACRASRVPFLQQWQTGPRALRITGILLQKLQTVSFVKIKACARIMRRRGTRRKKRWEGCGAQQVGHRKCLLPLFLDQGQSRQPPIASAAYQH